MEFISFIKGLQKKGKIYQDVWMSILFRLEEKDTIELNRRLDLSKSQYYRIISFGMKLWNEKIPNTPIELNYGKLSILKTETIKQVKPKAEKKVVKEPEKVEASINMEEVYESIISYLNQKAGTGYKSQTTSYRTFINARLKAGYKLEDFYKVIDNKSTEWIGTDFQKFLRPETLFGNKFDSYLNQITTKKTKQEIAYEQVSEATKLGWNTSN
jgi:uncharacterized phage protein (TIGR02220 family)